MRPCNAVHVYFRADLPDNSLDLHLITQQHMRQFQTGHRLVIDTDCQRVLDVVAHTVVHLVTCDGDEAAQQEKPHDPELVAANIGSVDTPKPHGVFRV